MAAKGHLRLIVWSDTWPALYPPDATLERVPWETAPEDVASRAKGLEADAVLAIPPGRDGAGPERLIGLRAHTTLPLWLLAPDGTNPAAGVPRDALEPLQVMASLTPQAVERALGTPDPLRPADRAAPGPQVAVFGPSGGVGASTVAIHLAQVFAAWRLDTVLVDMNLHAPDLALLLRAWPAQDRESRLETYLRNPKTSPVPVQERLALVPGLSDLENLDDVSVGAAVALLERLAPAIRVVDTAPVVTDPAVYAALRGASHLVLVSEDRVACRIHLKRYRRLFLQLGLPWRDALLVVNHTRPGGALVTPTQMEEEIGLRPVSSLPYHPARSAEAPGPRRLDGGARSAIEVLAATILGRTPPKGRAEGTRWRPPVRPR